MRLVRSPLVLLAMLLPLVACAAPSSLAFTRAAELSGRKVLVDVRLPAVPATSAVVLVHGFMRSRATMTGHADLLAGEGVAAIAPDLPYLTDSRDNARALVELVARLLSGEIAGPIDRVVLVGFSAGGLAALLAASAPGVVGYVGLDAFDRPSGVGLAAAKALKVPSILLRAPPAFCNAYGISEPWAATLPPPTQDRVIEAATHCDFESPTDRLCTLFCGATDPRRQEIVRHVLVEATRAWLLPAARRHAAIR
ncbi:MAG: esterase/lipase family protein [Caldimonas sp.]